MADYKTFDVVENGEVNLFFEARRFNEDGFVYSISEKKYNYVTKNWELTFRKTPCEVAKLPL